MDKVLPPASYSLGASLVNPEPPELTEAFLEQCQACASKPPHLRTLGELELLVRLLRRHRIFDVMPDVVLRSIARQATLQVAAPGFSLSKAGSQASAMYVVLQGSVNVYNLPKNLNSGYRYFPHLNDVYEAIGAPRASRHQSSMSFTTGSEPVGATVIPGQSLFDHALIPPLFALATLQGEPHGRRAMGFLMEVLAQSRCLFRSSFLQQRQQLLPMLQKSYQARKNSRDREVDSTATAVGGQEGDTNSLASSLLYSSSKSTYAETDEVAGPHNSSNLSMQNPSNGSDTLSSASAASTSSSSSSSGAAATTLASNGGASNSVITGPALRPGLGAVIAPALVDDLLTEPMMEQPLEANPYHNTRYQWFSPLLNSTVQTLIASDPVVAMEQHLIYRGAYLQSLLSSRGSEQGGTQTDSSGATPTTSESAALGSGQGANNSANDNMVESPFGLCAADPLTSYPFTTVTAGSSYAHSGGRFGANSDNTCVLLKVTTRSVHEAILGYTAQLLAQRVRVLQACPALQHWNASELLRVSQIFEMRIFPPNRIIEGVVGLVLEGSALVISRPPLATMLGFADSLNPTITPVSKAKVALPPLSVTIPWLYRNTQAPKQGYSQNLGGASSSRAGSPEDSATVNGTSTERTPRQQNEPEQLEQSNTNYETAQEKAQMQKILESLLSGADPRGVRVDAISIDFARGSEDPAIETAFKTLERSGLLAKYGAHSGETGPKQIHDVAVEDLKKKPATQEAALDEAARHAFDLLHMYGLADSLPPQAALEVAAAFSDMSNMVCRDFPRELELDAFFHKNSDVGLSDMVNPRSSSHPSQQHLSDDLSNALFTGRLPNVPLYRDQNRNLVTVGLPVVLPTVDSALSAVKAGGSAGSDDLGSLAISEEGVCLHPSILKLITEGTVDANFVDFLGPLSIFNDDLELPGTPLSRAKQRPADNNLLGSVCSTSAPLMGRKGSIRFTNEHDDSILSPPLAPLTVVSPHAPMRAFVTTRTLFDKYIRAAPSHPETALYLFAQSQRRSVLATPPSGRTVEQLLYLKLWVERVIHPTQYPVAHSDAAERLSKGDLASRLPSGQEQAEEVATAGLADTTSQIINRVDYVAQSAALSRGTASGRNSSSESPSISSSGKEFALLTTFRRSLGLTVSALCKTTQASIEAAAVLLACGASGGLLQLRSAATPLRRVLKLAFSGEDRILYEQLNLDSPNAQPSSATLPAPLIITPSAPHGSAVHQPAGIKSAARTLSHEGFGCLLEFYIGDIDAASNRAGPSRGEFLVGALLDPRIFTRTETAASELHAALQRVFDALQSRATVLKSYYDESRPALLTTVVSFSRKGSALGSPTSPTNVSSRVATPRAAIEAAYGTLSSSVDKISLSTLPLALLLKLPLIAATLRIAASTYRRKAPHTQPSHLLDLGLILPALLNYIAHVPVSKIIDAMQGKRNDPERAAVELAIASAREYRASVTGSVRKDDIHLTTNDAGTLGDALAAETLEFATQKVYQFSKTLAAICSREIPSPLDLLEDLARLRILAPSDDNESHDDHVSMSRQIRMRATTSAAFTVVSGASAHQDQSESRQGSRNEGPATTAVKLPNRHVLADLPLPSLLRVLTYGRFILLPPGAALVEPSFAPVSAECAPDEVYIVLSGTVSALSLHSQDEEAVLAVQLSRQNRVANTVRRMHERGANPTHHISSSPAPAAPSSQDSILSPADLREAWKRSMISKSYTTIHTLDSNQQSEGEAVAVPTQTSLYISKLIKDRLTKLPSIHSLSIARATARAYKAWPLSQQLTAAIAADAAVQRILERVPSFAVSAPRVQFMAAGAARVAAAAAAAQHGIDPVYIAYNQGFIDPRRDRSTLLNAAALRRATHLATFGAGEAVGDLCALLGQSSAVALVAGYLPVAQDNDNQINDAPGRGGLTSLSLLGHAELHVAHAAASLEVNQLVSETVAGAVHTGTTIGMQQTSIAHIPTSTSANGVKGPVDVPLRTSTSAYIAQGARTALAHAGGAPALLASALRADDAESVNRDITSSVGSQAAHGYTLHLERLLRDNHVEYETVGHRSAPTSGIGTNTQLPQKGLPTGRYSEIFGSTQQYLNAATWSAEAGRQALNQASMSTHLLSNLASTQPLAEPTIVLALPTKAYLEHVLGIKSVGDTTDTLDEEFAIHEVLNKIRGALPASHSHSTVTREDHDDNSGETPSQAKAGHVSSPFGTSETTFMFSMQRLAGSSHTLSALKHILGMKLFRRPNGAALPNSVLQKLCFMSRFLFIKPGETITFQGMLPLGLYIVLDGSVDVTLALPLSAFALAKLDVQQIISQFTNKSPADSRASEAESKLLQDEIDLSQLQSMVFEDMRPLSLASLKRGDTFGEESLQAFVDSSRFRTSLSATYSAGQAGATVLLLSYDRLFGALPRRLISEIILARTESFFTRLWNAADLAIERLCAPISGIPKWILTILLRMENAATQNTILSLINAATNAYNDVSPQHSVANLAHRFATRAPTSTTSTSTMQPPMERLNLIPAYTPSPSLIATLTRSRGNQYSKSEALRQDELSKSGPQAGGAQSVQNPPNPVGGSTSPAPMPNVASPDANNDAVSPQVVSNMILNASANAKAHPLSPLFCQSGPVAWDFVSSMHVHAQLDRGSYLPFASLHSALVHSGIYAALYSDLNLSKPSIHTTMRTLAELVVAIRAVHAGASHSLTGSSPDHGLSSIVSIASSLGIDVEEGSASSRRDFGGQADPQKQSILSARVNIVHQLYQATLRDPVALDAVSTQVASRSTSLQHAAELLSLTNSSLSDSLGPLQQAIKVAAGTQPTSRLSHNTAFTCLRTFLRALLTTPQGSVGPLASFLTELGLASSQSPNEVRGGNFPSFASSTPGASVAASRSSSTSQKREARSSIFSPLPTQAAEVSFVCSFSPQMVASAKLSTIIDLVSKARAVAACFPFQRTQRLASAVLAAVGAATTLHNAALHQLDSKSAVTAMPAFESCVHATSGVVQSLLASDAGLKKALSQEPLLDMDESLSQKVSSPEKPKTLAILDCSLAMFSGLYERGAAGARIVPIPILAHAGIMQTPLHSAISALLPNIQAAEANALGLDQLPKVATLNPGAGAINSTVYTLASILDNPFEAALALAEKSPIASLTLSDVLSSHFTPHLIPFTTGPSNGTGVSPGSIALVSASHWADAMSTCAPPLAYQCHIDLFKRWRASVRSLTDISPLTLAATRVLHRIRVNCQRAGTTRLADALANLWHPWISAAADSALRTSIDSELNHDSSSSGSETGANAGPPSPTAQTIEKVVTNAASNNNSGTTGLLGSATNDIWARGWFESDDTELHLDWEDSHENEDQADDHDLASLETDHSRPVQSVGSRLRRQHPANAYYTKRTIEGALDADPDIGEFLTLGWSQNWSVRHRMHETNSDLVSPRDEIPGAMWPQRSVQTDTPASLVKNNADLPLILPNGFYQALIAAALASGNALISSPSTSTRLSAITSGMNAVGSAASLIWEVARPPFSLSSLNYAFDPRSMKFNPASVSIPCPFPGPVSLPNPVFIAYLATMDWMHPIDTATAATSCLPVPVPKKVLDTHLKGLNDVRSSQPRGESMLSTGQAMRPVDANSLCIVATSIFLPSAPLRSSWLAHCLRRLPGLVVNDLTSLRQAIAAILDIVSDKAVQLPLVAQPVSQETAAADAGNYPSALGFGTVGATSSAAQTQLNNLAQALSLGKSMIGGGFHPGSMTTIAGGAAAASAANLAHTNAVATLLASLTTLPMCNLVLSVVLNRQLSYYGKGRVNTTHERIFLLRRACANALRTYPQVSSQWFTNQLSAIGKPPQTESQVSTLSPPNSAPTLSRPPSSHVPATLTTGAQPAEVSVRSRWRQSSQYLLMSLASPSPTVNSASPVTLCVAQETPTTDFLNSPLQRRRARMRWFRAMRVARVIQLVDKESHRIQKERAAAGWYLKWNEATAILHQYASPTWTANWEARKAELANFAGRGLLQRLWSLRYDDRPADESGHGSSLRPYTHPDFVALCLKLARNRKQRTGCIAFGPHAGLLYASLSTDSEVLEEFYAALKLRQSELLGEPHDLKPSHTLDVKPPSLVSLDVALESATGDLSECKASNSPTKTFSAAVHCAKEESRSIERDIEQLLQGKRLAGSRSVRKLIHPQSVLGHASTFPARDDSKTNNPELQLELTPQAVGRTSIQVPILSENGTTKWHALPPGPRPHASGDKLLGGFANTLVTSLFVAPEARRKVELAYQHTLAPPIIRDRGMLPAPSEISPNARPSDGIQQSTEDPYAQVLATEDPLLRGQDVARNIVASAVKTAGNLDSSLSAINTPRLTTKAANTQQQMSPAVLVAELEDITAKQQAQTKSRVVAWRLSQSLVGEKVHQRARANLAARANLNDSAAQETTHQRLVRKSQTLPSPIDRSAEASSSTLRGTFTLRVRPPEGAVNHRGRLAVHSAAEEEDTEPSTATRAPLGLGTNVTLLEPEEAANVVSSLEVNPNTQVRVLKLEGLAGRLSADQICNLVESPSARV